MTTTTAKLGLTLATYGEGVGTWDSWWRDNFNRLEKVFATPYNGNPSGNVIGYFEGQQVFDYTNNQIYLCTATGNAASASWTRLESIINAVGNINALTALTAPAVGDLFAMWDLSASGNVSISATDWLKIINVLTAVTASDINLSTDVLVGYNQAASGPRKYTPQDFSGIDPIAYSARALSASQSYTLGSVVSFTHGLGSQAKGAQVWYKNVSTEGGYIAGDLILSNHYYDAGERGVATIIDNATQVKAAVAVNGVGMIKKDASGNFTMTASNWALVIEAWT